VRYVSVFDGNCKWTHNLRFVDKCMRWCGSILHTELGGRCKQVSLKLSVLTSEIYSACKIQIECVRKPVCASCNSTSWFGHVGFDDHFLRWGKFLFRYHKGHAYICCQWWNGLVVMQGTVLEGGSTVLWPLWFHASHAGMLSINTVIYYESDGATVGLMYRTVRMTHTIQVRCTHPSLFQDHVLICMVFICLLYEKESENQHFNQPVSQIRIHSFGCL
jgi:hypothetical protein